MPQKTRKEKIIADLRRKLATSTKPSLDTSPVQESKPVSTVKPEASPFVFTPVRKPVVRKTLFPPSVSLSVPDSLLIVSDLRRTFLLTGFVLFIELVLYWALELRGLHF